MIKLSDLNPKDDGAYFDRDLAKELLGKYKEAIEDYDQAINLNPTDDPHLLAYYNLRASSKTIRKI